MLNLEFFAFIFLIVYVGAIAVLFLFMVMTLDIKIANVSQQIQDFFSYRSLILFLILINLLIFLHEDFIFFNNSQTILAETQQYVNYSAILKTESHLEIVGKAIFKDYILGFLFCGFILFIAMIGAIVVTVDDFKLKLVKQQDSIVQGLRNQDFAVFNFKIYKDENINFNK